MAKFNKHDAEKWLYLIIFAIGSLAIVYRFIRGHLTDPTMVGFVLGVGGLALGRKISSYVKGETYYANNQLHENSEIVKGEAYYVNSELVTEDTYNKGG